MKAVILAAGQGTRLRPLTDFIPKCMVEYQGRPIIHYAIEALRTAGIENINVVTGYCCDKIKAEKINFIHNENYENTTMVDSFFLAISQLLNEDLLVSYGDIIYYSPIVTKLLKSSGDIVIAADQDWRKLWEKRFENPLEDAETFESIDDILINIGKKPTLFEQVNGQYMGLLKFSHHTFPLLKKIYNNKKFDSMTMFLSEIKKYIPIHVVWTSGQWLEIDQPSDLDVII